LCPSKMGSLWSIVMAIPNPDEPELSIED